LNQIKRLNLREKTESVTEGWQSESDAHQAKGLQSMEKEKGGEGNKKDLLRRSPVGAKSLVASKPGMVGGEREI